MAIKVGFYLEYRTLNNRLKQSISISAISKETYFFSMKELGYSKEKLI